MMKSKLRVLALVFLLGISSFGAALFNQQTTLAYDCVGPDGNRSNWEYHSDGKCWEKKYTKQGTPVATVENGQTTYTCSGNNKPASGPDSPCLFWEEGDYTDNHDAKIVYDTGEDVPAENMTCSDNRFTYVKDAPDGAGCYDLNDDNQIECGRGERSNPNLDSGGVECTSTAVTATPNGQDTSIMDRELARCDQQYPVVGGDQGASLARNQSCKAGVRDPESCNNPNITQESRDICNRAAQSNQEAEEAAEGNGEDGEGGGEAEDKPTCAIDKIGWLLCPIIEKSAQASDFAFEFLADQFLSVEIGLYNSESGTFDAWESMRDLANIAFVIVFLIIIYSQITNAAISNYGIKKILPRLIIGAILVNTSYWICQGMVDLSNIIGYNLQKFLTDLAIEAGGSNIGPSASQTLGSTDGGMIGDGDGWLVKATVAVLALAVLVWILLGPIIGIVMMILITSITIVIILLLRKAFIVLLIFISPLAFVAYLLPNTEKYFDKWLNMFWGLLMVFPVVAALMGGGQLASAVVLSAGSCQESVYNVGSAEENECIPYGPGGGSETSLSTGFVAAGIAVAPLMAVWAVLQGALSAAGAIGGKIAGAIQKNTDRGVRGTAGAGKKFAKYGGRAARWGARQTSVGQAAEARIDAAKLAWKSRTHAAHARREHALTDYIHNDGNTPEFMQKIAGKDGSVNLKNSAASMASKHLQEEEALRTASLNKNMDGISIEADMNGVGKKLVTALEEGDIAGARAASKILQEGGEAGAEALRTAIGTIDSTLKSGGKVDAAALGHVRGGLAANSALKNTDNDIATWAKGGAPRDSDSPFASLAAIRGSTSYIDNLSDIQKTTQRAGAISTGGIITDGAKAALTPEVKRRIRSSNAKDNITDKTRNFF